MSKKKEKKSTDEKFTLLELVENCDVRLPIIVMELHQAGLLDQYNYEKQNWRIEDIEPSMTQKEFDKIIGVE